MKVDHCSRARLGEMACQPISNCVRFRLTERSPIAVEIDSAAVGTPMAALDAVGIEQRNCQELIPAAELWILLQSTREFTNEGFEGIGAGHFWRMLATKDDYRLHWQAGRAGWHSNGSALIWIAPDMSLDPR